MNSSEGIISEVTYYDWIKRGKAGEDPFLKFLKSIKKARAKAVISNVLVIQTAGKKSWQAAAWWLEQTHHKDWGRKESIKLKKEVSLEKKDSKTLQDFLKKEKLLTPEQKKRF